MHYHWGLGIGHLYAHWPASSSHMLAESDAPDVIPHEWETEEGAGENNINTHIQDGNSDVDSSDDSELGLENRNFEGWEDDESEGSDGEGVDYVMIEEEDFTGM